MQARALLLGISMATAALVAAAPAVAAGSCSTSSGSCSFTCKAGDTITVSVSGEAGAYVSAQGACGGTSANCSGQRACDGDSRSPASSDGQGTCTISGGTGTCAASGGSCGGTVECTVDDVCNEVVCPERPPWESR